MTTKVSKAWDMLRLVRRGGPAICNVAITNSCNATCDFCNFAYNKNQVGKLRWIDADQFPRALDILHTAIAPYFQPSSRRKFQLRQFRRKLMNGYTCFYPEMPQPV